MQYCLDRIDSLDDNSPKLNAVLTVNPLAKSIAETQVGILQAGGMSGSLFAIPVLLKDNVDTGDGMPCTVGARCMANNVPDTDSPIVGQLRSDGAIILGKTRLSEWANFHSYQSSSGWSAVNGQTKNPYDLSRNPCGSSSGSGAAVSANLCVMAIGTETNGSIVCPSNNNGVVGVKPTLGLLSRSRIVPISHTQDTPGPMTRTVKDAAIALGVMTAVDPGDDATLVPQRVAQSNYHTARNEATCKGLRIGCFTKPLREDSTEHTQGMLDALDDLRELGATIFEVDSILPADIRQHTFQVLLYEFKDGLNSYLSDKGQAAPVADLAQIIEVTFADSVEMQYHDHLLLKDAHSHLLKMAREGGVNRVLAEYNLDAIVAPTGSPAWETSLYHFKPNLPQI